jgi:hypothetical protein
MQPRSGERLQPTAQAVGGVRGKITSPKGRKKRYSAPTVEFTHRKAQSSERTHFKREGSMAEPTYEELKAKLSQLEKEVETKKRSGDLIFKVGEKGGVSVYGLGRFPVTLYYEQWNRLLGAANEIKSFMEENKSKLKLKDQS